MGNSSSDGSVWKEITKQQVVDREKFEKIWTVYSKDKGFITEPKLSMFLKDVTTHLIPDQTVDQVTKTTIIRYSLILPALFES